MIRTFCASLVSVVFLSSASAATSQPDKALTKVDANCSCKSPLAEDLENPRKFSFGAFSGRCIDACRFRKSDLLLNEANATFVFSNFMHDGEFWKVKIQPNGVSRARIGFEEFMPGIFHVFLVFDFDQDRSLVLQPQTKETATEAQKVNSLVFSPEGIPAQDMKYNFFDAFLNRYLVGFRLLSTEQVKQYSVVKLKHSITIYELNLSKTQLNTLLTESLKMAEQESFGHKYRLFSNNCATNILDLLEKSKPILDSEDLILKRAIQLVERSLPISGPIGFVKLLTKKKLISPESVREIKPDQSMTL